MANMTGEQKPRARKSGASSITPDEVRAWADTVQIGECITFPNGLVVDKRVDLGTGWNWSSTGYRCGTCGTWVFPNTSHACWQYGQAGG